MLAMLCGEEGIVNALLAGETMTAADDIRVYGMRRARVHEIMKKYGRRFAWRLSSRLQPAFVDRYDLER